MMPHGLMPSDDEIVVEARGPFETVAADGTRGPFHDFVLLRYDQNPLNDWEATFTDYCKQIHGGPTRFQDFVRISDEVLVALQDQLNWIKSLTTPCRAIPAKPKIGLHWYGPSIIDANGAAALGAIFGAWAQILDVGPDPIELRTPCFRYEDTQCNGQTEMELIQIVVAAPRAEIVEAFRTIQKTAQQVTDKPSEYYIAHLGI